MMEKLTVGCLRKILEDDTLLDSTWVYTDQGDDFVLCTFEEGTGVKCIATMQGLVINSPKRKIKTLWIGCESEGTLVTVEEIQKVIDTYNTEFGDSSKEYVAAGKNEEK